MTGFCARLVRLGVPDWPAGVQQATPGNGMAQCLCYCIYQQCRPACGVSQLLTPNMMLQRVAVAGAYRIDAGGSPTMLRSLMYKLSYYE